MHPAVCALEPFDSESLVIFDNNDKLKMNRLNIPIISIVNFRQNEKFELILWFVLVAERETNLQYNNNKWCDDKSTET